MNFILNSKSYINLKGSVAFIHSRLSILVNKIMQIFVDQKKITGPVMRLFLGLASLFFLPGSAIAFYNGISMIGKSPDNLRLFVTGLAAGGLIYFLILRKWNHFLTFEHELTHAVMSWMFLRRVTRFIATKHNGGVVYHSGGFGGEFGNVMITLAPYYFPTFTIILLLFQPLIPLRFHAVYIIMVAATLIYHHLSTWRELRINWHSDTFTEAGTGNPTSSDIARSGFTFSFIFVLTLTLFFNAMVFWLTKYSYSGFIALVKDVFNDSFSIFYFLITKIVSWIT